MNLIDLKKITIKLQNKSYFKNKENSFLFNLLQSPLLNEYLENKKNILDKLIKDSIQNDLGNEKQLCFLLLISMPLDIINSKKIVEYINLYIDNLNFNQDNFNLFSILDKISNRPNHYKDYPEEIFQKILNKTDVIKQSENYKNSILGLCLYFEAYPIFHKIYNELENNNLLKIDLNKKCGILQNSVANLIMLEDKHLNNIQEDQFKFIFNHTDKKNYNYKQKNHLCYFLENVDKNLDYMSINNLKVGLDLIQYDNNFFEAYETTYKEKIQTKFKKLKSFINNNEINLLVKDKKEYSSNKKNKI